MVEVSDHEQEVNDSEAHDEEPHEGHEGDRSRSPSIRSLSKRLKSSDFHGPVVEMRHIEHQVADERVFTAIANVRDEIEVSLTGGQEAVATTLLTVTPVNYSES